MITERISILGNITKSLLNHKEDIVYKFFNDAKKLERESSIHFSPKLKKKYDNLVQWESEDIHPCMPYALMTHMQISLVTDKKFPFSPLGIIHKNEKIECIKKLEYGNWKMKCVVPIIRKVANGFEMELISSLYINDDLAWRSTTTAFKRTKKCLNREALYREPLHSSNLINIPKDLGRKYAVVSNNCDLIHISDFTAKMMGHKKAIIHGMWTAARGLSEIKNIKYPITMSFKFISPIYMNSNIIFQNEEFGFRILSENGNRIHLESHIEQAK